MKIRRRSFNSKSTLDDRRTDHGNRGSSDVHEHTGVKPDENHNKQPKATDTIPWNSATTTNVTVVRLFCCFAASFICVLRAAVYARVCESLHVYVCVPAQCGGTGLFLTADSFHLFEPDFWWVVVCRIIIPAIDFLSVGIK